MSVTGFLSLWISNTATASMMLPIVLAIAKQLIAADKSLAVEGFKKTNKIHGFL